MNRKMTFPSVTDIQTIGRALRKSRGQDPYDRETFVWGSEDGTHTIAKDLTTNHLKNIINWILDHDNQYDDGVLGFMIGEATHRRLTSFAKGEPYVFVDVEPELRARVVQP
jgi:hypothetical protein